VIVSFSLFRCGRERNSSHWPSKNYQEKFIQSCVYNSVRSVDFIKIPLPFTTPFQCGTLKGVSRISGKKLLVYFNIKSLIKSNLFSTQLGSNQLLRLHQAPAVCVPGALEKLSTQQLNCLI
jgi:hypothetical protein